MTNQLQSQQGRNSLLISPHDDDQVLFAAFTLIREKPLVAIVTDAYIQYNRGDVGCAAEIRARESQEGCVILDCPVLRLGIRDDILNRWAIKFKFDRLQNFDVVYVPALQGGNPQHDMISEVAKEVFGDKCVFYTTYAPGKLYTEGDIEIKPTPEELELKNKALLCFQSQINLAATKPHFDAIKGKSEWRLK